MRRFLSAPRRALSLDRYGRRAWPDDRFDVIVVPGARVYADGRPSFALRRRVTLAVSLWRQGRAPVLLMSGCGTGGRPEADVMADLARGMGVADVEVEAESMNTADNARLSYAAFPAQRALVATDIAHVRRCEREFGRWYPHARGVGAPASVRSRVRLATREALRSAWLG